MGQDQDGVTHGAVNGLAHTGVCVGIGAGAGAFLGVLIGHGLKRWTKFFEDDSHGRSRLYFSFVLFFIIGAGITMSTMASVMGFNNQNVVVGWVGFLTAVVLACLLPVPCTQFCIWREQRPA